MTNDPRVRPPIDNEIPDSSNVQDSRDAGADVPQAVDGKPESRQAQLNLGRCTHVIRQYSARYLSLPYVTYVIHYTSILLVLFNLNLTKSNSKFYVYTLGKTLFILTIRNIRYTLYVNTLGII